MWRHPDLRLRDPHLLNTEAICREVLSLPMSAETTPEQVDMVVQAVRSYFRLPPPR